MTSPTLPTDENLSQPPKTDLLHTLAQAANVLFNSQDDIQASPSSMSGDRTSKTTKGCEDIPPTTPIGTPSQSEAPVDLVGLTKALTGLTQKFDDKLTSVQTELNNFNNNMVTRNELVEVRGLVSGLKSLVEKEVEQRAIGSIQLNHQLSKLDNRVSSIESTLEIVQGIQSDVAGLYTELGDLRRTQDIIYDHVTHIDPPPFPEKDDVKKGEKQDKGKQVEGEQTKHTTEGEKQAEGESLPKSPQSYSRKKSVGKKSCKETGVVNIYSDDESDDEDEFDAQPINTILRRSKRKRAESTSKVQSPQGSGSKRQKEKAAGKRKVTETESELDELINASAALHKMTREEYMEFLSATEQKAAEELDESKRLKDEYDIGLKLQNDYTYRAHVEELIMECSAIYNNRGELELKYTSSNNTVRKIELNQIHALGFYEWKCIAKIIKRSSDQTGKEEVLKRLHMLVHVSYELGLLRDNDYTSYCVIHQEERRRRQPGVIPTFDGDSSRKYQVPKDVHFLVNTYVRKLDGFLYSDEKGEQCMIKGEQVKETDPTHLFYILERCRSQQSLPFRRKVVTHLFENLAEVQKIQSLASRCDIIRAEYKRLLQMDEDAAQNKRVAGQS